MKAKYIILLCACLAIAVVCICLNLNFQHTTEDSGEYLEEKLDSIKQSVTTGLEPDTSETEDTAAESQEDPIDTDTDIGTFAEDTSTEPETTEQSTPVISSTIDFDALKAINNEIVAWIEIDGTRIDYPILQSQSNDKKYLSTAYDGSAYIGGAIFTEKTYNSTDFNDPVTMIYGHTMRSGNLFGQLQRTYSSKDMFKAHSQIKLYLPDEVRLYTVFAAVPYAKIHVLHTYDFSNEYWFNRFFKDVKGIREIGANFDNEAFPEYGDRIIMLSVCLNEDTTRRYLVMAVYNEDLADNSR